MSSAAVVLGALRANMSVKQVGNPTHSQRTFLEKKSFQRRTNVLFVLIFWLAKRSLSNCFQSGKKFLNSYFIKFQMPTFYSISTVGIYNKGIINFH